MAIVYITAGIISLMATTIGVLVACKIQARILHKTGLEHEAWQHAQEAHQNLWEVKQRKLALELERSLNQRIEELHDAWLRWEFNAAQQYAKLTLEQKLDSLPYIEDIPVPSDEYPKLERVASSSQLSHPFSFFRTDLRGQDLSRRFLQHADFRETQLENANFYMSDLAGASFKGANLSGANLAGANLKGADLRGAILTEANLLVSDLNGAILNGANLSGARNLTSEQFNSTIFNHETQINLEQDITHPRIARIHFTDLRSSIVAPSTEFDTAIPTSMQNGKVQFNTN
ncbi:MAG: pentapeptide repeat-containing protein [Ktedonobacteraceae bacterium]